MGILSILGGIASALFGGGSGGSNQSAVTDIAKRILPATVAEKAAAEVATDEEEIKDVASARAYDPKDMPVVVYQPGMGIIPWFLLWVLDLIDHVIDSLNHAIRPVGLIWAGLVLSGKLPVPHVDDPKMWTIFLTMVTFFYGGRTLVKDILPGIMGMLKK